MLTYKHLRQNETTKDELVKQIKDMGIKAGDGILVHSSLSSMGKIAGGADAVVDALVESVGPEGHIMFPAFSFGAGFGPFDPNTTPTTMGIIPETARKRKEFIRSNYPHNSVIVAGPHADIIVRDHTSRGHCRCGDPIDMFAMMGGYVMLLGVTFRNNTTVHIGECYGDLPHRRKSFAGPYQDELYADGSKVTLNISGGPDCSEAFHVVEGIMRERNHIIDGKMGSAPVKLMKGRDVIFDTVDIIKRAPWSLYCNNPLCESCVRNRKF